MYVCTFYNFFTPSYLSVEDYVRGKLFKLVITDGVDVTLESIRWKSHGPL